MICLRNGPFDGQRRVAIVGIIPANCIDLDLLCGGFEQMCVSRRSVMGCQSGHNLARYEFDREMTGVHGGGIRLWYTFERHVGGAPWKRACIHLGLPQPN